MTPQEYVDLAGRTMVADGADVEWAGIGPAQALAGHSASFVPQAMSRLHVVTAVAHFSAVDQLDVDGFSRDVSSYAKARSRALLGAQSGIGAFAVLVSDRVTPAALTAAQQKPRMQFAVRVQPVVVDLETSTVHTFRGSMVWGFALNGYLRRKLATQVPNPA